MQQIGVALVGAGWAGERHAMAYRSLPDQARLVALVETRQEIAAIRARQWEVPFVTDDLAAALARPDVDAVDICLPHALHAEAALAALAAGKHVLIEKPFATSLAAADEMIGAAVTAGRILMVAENARYDPVYRRMAEIIAEGAIGPPFLIRIARDHHMRAQLQQRPWFLTDPTGGIIWSGGIHDIETVRMLTADAAVTRVYATAARKSLGEMADGRHERRRVYAGGRRGRRPLGEFRHAHPRRRRAAARRGLRPARLAPHG